MFKIIEKIISYIRRLQRSSHKIKQRWVLGSSAVAMVAVVGLWVVYIQASFPVINPSIDEVVGEAEHEYSLFGTIGRGFEVIIGDIEDVLANTYKKITQTRNYYIETQ